LIHECAFTAKEKGLSSFLIKFGPSAISFGTGSKGIRGMNTALQQSKTQRSGVESMQRRLLWWACAVGALLLVIGWNTITPTAQAQGDGDRWRGIVETMPADGLIGTWVVGGRTAVADGATDFNQDDAPLQVGGCAEVRLGANGLATEIKGKAAFECAETSTPSGTATVDGTTTPESSKTPSPTGSPTDDGTTTPEASETPSPTDDGTTTPAPSETPSPTSSPNALERYGYIEQMPATGLIGAWIIAGTTYTTTQNTEFKQEDGAFAVGVCAKVELSAPNNPAAVRELETERAIHCAERREGEFYGVITAFPAELTGDWTIGGMTFRADQNTSFAQERVPFDTGVTVEVKFVLEGTIQQATRIESKFANDSGGQDDDGNGILEGEDGHAFGRIDTVPDGLIGRWIIGGLPYTATAQTRLEQGATPFAQGGQVRVEFFVDATGGRIAQEIERTATNGEVDDQAHSKLVGFVQALPASGFLGVWQVGDVAFTATAATVLKEDHGLLGVGAYVTVEYFTSEGVNQIHEIESQVPPGAGDDRRIGAIERIDDNPTAAAHTAVGIWRIGGVDYEITPATDLNEQLGELTVGATAVVNSYRTSDGRQVATQVQGVVLTERLYLPLTLR
jgi:hypothetical protein